MEKTYGNRGADVLAKELAAVDGAVAGLHRIEVPDAGHLHPRHRCRRCPRPRRSSSAP